MEKKKTKIENQSPASLKLEWSEYITKITKPNKQTNKRIEANKE